jgi:hypothetical protein
VAASPRVQFHSLGKWNLLASPSVICEAGPQQSKNCERAASSEGLALGEVLAPYLPCKTRELYEGIRLVQPLVLVISLYPMLS